MLHLINRRTILAVATVLIVVASASLSGCGTIGSNVTGNSNAASQGVGAVGTVASKGAVRFTPNFTPPAGIFGSQFLSFSGNATINAWNSNNGTYAATQTTDPSGVLAATNGNIAGAVSLSGHSWLFASVQVGTGGNTATDITTSGDSKIYGSESVEGSAVSLVTPTTPAGTVGPAASFSGGSQTLAPGNYASFSATGNTQVTLTSGTYYFANGWSTSGKSTVQIDSSNGPVQIYFGGTWTGSGSSIDNPTGIPSNLQILGTSTASSATFSGSSAGYFTFLAPTANVAVTGSGGIFGSVAAHSVTLSGNAAIHYDLHLNQTPKPGPFVYNTAAPGGPGSSFEGIYAFTVNATSGALTPVAGSPFDILGQSFIGGVTVDPTNRFAYMATQTPGGPTGISAFTIDGTTGALTPVAGSPFTAGNLNVGNIADGSQVAVDPTGRFLYTANVEGTTVSAFTIDGTSGALTPVAGSPYASGNGPFNLTVDPTGQFLYNTNFFDNTVSAFTIDATSGALTPVAEPFAVGNTPYDLTADPTGGFLYVSNGGDGTISAFTIDATSGALTPVAGSPFAAGNIPEGGTVDPTGRFLYVVNTADATVSAFTIDGISGTLTPVAGSPFGLNGSINPYSVAVDATGSFAYVADSGGVSAFTIDGTSGALTPVAGSPYVTGFSPFSVTTTH